MKKNRLYKRTLAFVFLTCIVATVVNAQGNPTSAFKFTTTYNQPVDIHQLESGHWFIEFDKAYFGTIVLRFKTPQVGPIELAIGEKLSGPYSIDEEPGGTIRYQKVTIDSIASDGLYTVELIADKRNTKAQAIALPDSFGIIMPFRYCEIKNLNVPMEDVEVYQKAFHYQFNDEASYFHSSDSILNSIYDLCKHTIKATSFTGYYVDGDRERIPYEADAYINQLSHYAVDSVYDMAQRTNEYFIDHCTWPTEWILHTALLFYYDYQYTNDLTLVEKYYDNLKVKSLMALEREDGFISSTSEKLTPDLIEALGFDTRHESIKDIVDWPKKERDDYDFKDVNTVVNAFYYENLRVMSLLAEAIGKDQDAVMFSTKAQELKKRVQQALIDAHTGLYIDGLGSTHSSLHANMFTLAFGLVPDDNLPQVIDFIKSKGMACSVYGAQYLLEGLCANGEVDYALDLITDTIGDRNWHNMLRVGSTMTLEAWDMKYKGNLDWNHAWGTAPLNCIVRDIWGITPDDPGFETIRIEPQLGSLANSSIKVPTKVGCVVADYHRINNNKKDYYIELPDDASAKFYVGDDVKKIYLDGKRIKDYESYLVLEKKHSNIRIKY